VHDGNGAASQEIYRSLTLPVIQVKAPGPFRMAKSTPGKREPT
jgi:hypothetical protein